MLRIPTVCYTLKHDQPGLHAKYNANNAEKSKNVSWKEVEMVWSKRFTNAALT